MSTSGCSRETRKKMPPKAGTKESTKKGTTGCLGLQWLRWKAEIVVAFAGKAPVLRQDVLPEVGANFPAEALASFRSTFGSIGNHCMRAGDLVSLQ